VTEGTGILAQVDGVPTCGKTGTAQKVEPWGGYSRTRSRMTFVGFFPKTEPEFVVAVLVDEPRTERFAGSAACPVFKTVGEGLVKWVRAGKRRALLESGRLAAQTGPAGQSLNLVCPTSFARYVTPE
jgi:cell division protein FtsI/penicillin-binding protein 2